MPAVVKPLISKLPLPFVIARAVPPSELSAKNVLPPEPPPVPPLVMIVALPAFDVSKNFVEPPVGSPGPPPLLAIVALPAVDVLKNSVVPPPASVLVPALLMIVALPAVDASVKFVPSSKPELMIVCVVPDLFTIPAPSTVSVDPPVSIVKALAPGLKVIDSTVAFPVRNSEVTVEVLNVAVSPGLTGALGDVDQLVPKFQSPSSGLGTQTASTASTGVDIATNSNSATRGARIEVAIRPGSLLTDWVSI